MAEKKTRLTGRRLVRVLGALLLLIGVLWWVDIGAVITRLRATQTVPMVAALLLVQIQIVLSGLRWCLTAAALGQTLSYRRAVAEYYVASLLNQLLPGGVSGDVIRAWRNRGDDMHREAWRVPVQAIVIERLAGQIVLILVAVAGMAAWWLNAGHRVPGAGTLLGGIGMAAGGAVLLLLATARWAPQRTARFVRTLMPALRRAWLGPGRFGLQAALSLAIVASYLGAFAGASQAVGAAISPLAVMALVPLVLLTMLMPVSIAGWGMREAAAAALWLLAGASAADGVAASVVYGLVSLLGAAPGALLITRRRAHAGTPRRA